MELNKENLRDLAERAVKDKKIEIVKIHISGPESNQLASMEIWHPNKVDLDMCELVSNQINAVLDEEDPFEESYTLEVASLPLTRKLSKFDDFRRAIGETLEIKFKDKEKKECKGLLIEVNEESITLEANKKKSELGIKDIKLGKIIF